MSKRLTVIYEVPEDYNVTRITGTGELEVVRCEWMDAMARLAAAEAEVQKQIQFKLDAYTEITSLRNTVNMLEAARAAKGGRDE